MMNYSILGLKIKNPFSPNGKIRQIWQYMQTSSGSWLFMYHSTLYLKLNQTLLATTYADYILWPLCPGCLWILR